MALFFNGVNLDEWGGFTPSFDYPMRQGQRTSDRIIGIRLHGQVAPEDREAFFDAVVRPGRQYLRGSVIADATRASYSYGGTDMTVSLCCLMAVSAVSVDTYNTNQSISDPLLVQVDVGTASNRVSWVVAALEAPETGYRALSAVGAYSGLILVPPRLSQSDEHEIAERPDDQAGKRQGPGELRVHASSYCMFRADRIHGASTVHQFERSEKERPPCD